jgi:cbb3-type cytochrome oxidase subunit 1
MYFFVRFTGIMALIVGVLLMLLGVSTTIYGFIQNAALVDLANNYWLVSSDVRLVDARFYAALLGLGLFLAGMFTSALGQLMLVFADVAANTKETNAILRGMRKVD